MPAVSLGEDPLREGLVKTPDRVARAFEFLTKGYEADPRTVIGDALFTEEFCNEHKFFIYKYNPERGVYEVADRNWKSVKHKLLAGLTNFGQPFIYASDGNFENRGELLLEHRHEGIDLRINYAKDTLKNLHGIWARPVHLKTMIEGKNRMFSFDGEKHLERKIDG